MSWNTTSFSDGDYYVAINGIDVVGNTGIKQILAHIDNAVPSALISNPVAGQNVNGIFNVTGYARDRNFDRYELWYKIDADNVNYTMISSSTTEKLNSTDSLGEWNTISLSTENHYILELRVYDKSGSFTTKDARVGIDHSPSIDPVTSPTNISSQTITGTKPKGTEVKVNGQPATSTSDTTWSKILTGFSDGTNQISAVSVDTQGNIISSVVSREILYDNTPPTVSITSPAENGTHT
jgi:hypothetical protein